MQYKVAFWGLGEIYEKITYRIQDEIKKGNIIVSFEIDKSGCGARYTNNALKPSDIIGKTYDYIVITSEKYYDQIAMEALDLGIAKDKLLHGRVFLNADFDFDLYKKQGWLYDNYFENVFVSEKYVDFNRIYKKKNIEISLGRMSSVGGAKLEHGGNIGKNIINIGNYTNISWDCIFELGLNLDHDYKNIMNYGLTHLLSDYKMNSKAVYRIDIGNDVWIGRGCVLKSGTSVGDGAVVASNSVVVKDVPPFAIVGGNPAEVIRFRFEDDVVERIQKIKWWDLPVEEIIKYKDSIGNPEVFIEKICKD